MKILLEKNLKNVNLKFIYKNNSPTIVKRRIIDHSSNNKAFGIYKYNEQSLDEKTKKNYLNI